MISTSQDWGLKIDVDMYSSLLSAANDHIPPSHPPLSHPSLFSVGPFLVSAQGDDEDVVMDEGESVSMGGGEEDEEDDMEVEDEEDDEPVKVPDMVSVFSFHWCGCT